MQTGIDKKNIKIKSSIIYLNGNKHAQVLNNCLQYYDFTSQSASVDPAVASSSVPDQRSIPQVPNVTINDQNDAEMDSNSN